MNNFSNDEKRLGNLIRAAHAVALTDSERARARNFLHEYARMKPIRAGGHRAPRFRPIPLITALLIIILGASTAAAAEHALPGDKLYGVKVNINEPVVSALTISTESKAEWAIERAERRMEEATALALVGELDDETGKELDAEIETQIVAAEEARIAVAETDIAAAERIETSLRATLIAHTMVLDDVRAEIKNEQSRAHIDAIRDRVSTRSRSFASAKVPAPEAAVAMMMSAEMASDTTSLAASDDSGDDETNVEETRAIAKKRLDASERLVKKNERRMHEDTRSRLRARLDGAKTTFAEAEDALSQGNRSEAYSRFGEALQEAIETRAFLAAQANTAPTSSAASTTATTTPETESESTNIEVEIQTGGTIESATKTHIQIGL